MASSSDSLAPKRRRTDAEITHLLLIVNDLTEKKLSRRYVQWDLQKTFSDFQSDQRIGFREGVKCYTGGSLLVNSHVYNELISRKDQTVQLYLRVLADCKVSEPAPVQRQPRDAFQLVMLKDVAMLKEQNEETLRQYPQSVAPVKLKLSVDDKSGMLLLRWSCVSLYSGTGVDGLDTGTTLTGRVLGPASDALEDGELAERATLAPATVLCALQRAMGERKPKFELEMFAGEEGALRQLHEELVPNASVILVQLDDYRELLLVPVETTTTNLSGPTKVLQLFLGYVQTLDTLKTEYERLIAKKIPIILDLDGTLGCKPEDKHAVDPMFDRDKDGRPESETYLTAKKKIEYIQTKMKVRGISTRQTNDLQEELNKWSQAHERWEYFKILKLEGAKKVSPDGLKILERFDFHIIQDTRDLFFLRPHIRPFLETVRNDFDPFIVTAASKDHARHFLDALLSVDRQAQYYCFGSRLFYTNGSPKSLAQTTRTSLLSTIIIDDCMDGHGYVQDKSTWAESDGSDNIWRIKAWTPLLSDLDDDAQLEYLAGRGTPGSPWGSEGILHRCRRRFLESLENDSMEMRSRRWYDSSPSKHEPVEQIHLRGINRYLMKEKERLVEWMSKGADRVERASRSPSPMGHSGSFTDEPFWIVPDTSSLMKQANQSLDCQQRELQEFERLARFQSNVIKIFIPCAVQEEIVNHGKSCNPKLHRPAKVISDFNSWFVKKGFVVFEDKTEGDATVGLEIPRTISARQYRDHRIIKSAERKKDALQAVKAPGKISCVLLSNDKDMASQVFGTARLAADARKQPLHVMTLAQLQRFMYNMSQDSVRQANEEIPTKLLKSCRTGVKLQEAFFDSESSKFGISRLEDLPETTNDSSYTRRTSIEEWIKTLKKEGFGPPDYEQDVHM